MVKELLIDWKNYPCGANEQIYSHLTKKYLEGSLDKDGYKIVGLKCIDGKIRNFRWHRVIYTYFYGAIPEDMEINHINEIKTDNRLSNLECISHLENIRYGTGIERHAEILRGKPNPKVAAKEKNHPLKSKPVVAVDKDNNVVYEFPSTQEAERNGFNHWAISACCRGLRRTHKGLRWYYLEDYLKIIKGVA